MTSITLHTFDSVNPAAHVDGVVIRLYNQAGDTFITQLSTDVEGKVITDVPDATYWVRLFKVGFSFASKTLIEVVDGELNEWDIPATNLSTYPPSAYSNMCRITGYVSNAQGFLSHLPIITFSLPQETRVANGRILGTEKVKVQPNNEGFVDVELLQNAVYTVTMPIISDEVIKVKVPKLQQCSITDLIYPRGVATTSIPSTITITAGTSTATSIKFGVSSGVQLSDPDINTSPASLIRIVAPALTTSIVDGTMYLFADTAGTYSVTIYSVYSAGDIDIDDIIIGQFTVEAV